jgi:hypothetical protein
MTDEMDCTAQQRWRLGEGQWEESCPLLLPMTSRIIVLATVQ